jgi:deoxyadenosine/deoxycytidine kinase
MRLISIEGNIGTGKTTFIQIFTKLLSTLYPEHEIVFLKEPIDEWFKITNDDNRNILDYFYKDQQRWSYTFQMNAFISRMKQIEPYANQDIIVVCERCVYTDRNVFAKMLHDDNSLDKLEWDLYRQWYRFLIQSSNVEVEGIIYVNCSPNKCLERISHRAREGESVIPLDYLSNLHNYHKNWIENTTVPVLDINTECDGYEYPMEEVMKYVSRL